MLLLEESTHVMLISECRVSFIILIDGNVLLSLTPQKSELLQNESNESSVGKCYYMCYVFVKYCRFIHLL